MTPRVFISYRRDDAQNEAGRLADAIRSDFGKDSVFLDIEEIQPGATWPDALRSAVENAALVVALIGPEWILARDEYGRRRIDDPGDWVLGEIKLALERDKKVLPLLVRHARMPPSNALPPEIAALSSRQAFEIRADRWNHDLEPFLGALAESLGPRRARIESLAAEETAPAFTADDFRAVVLGFDSADMRARESTAKEVKRLASLLRLDDVLAFAHSLKTSERIGAAVALGVHTRSPVARADLRVLAALGDLLTDRRSSLVRYRAAEVLRDRPTLAHDYLDDLALLAETDQNGYVRKMAAEALGRAGA